MSKNKKSLVETHPEVAKQWHPTKNGDLTPDEVTLPKFMSSIFEDKLEFYDQDYRTPKLNPSIDLIFQIISDLELSENKKGDTFSDVSRKVLEVGIEPTLPKELDFESSASTNSATRAKRQVQI